MSRHELFEWVFTLTGVACLMKWMWAEDTDALIVASMCFVLAGIHGIKHMLSTRSTPTGGQA